MAETQQTEGITDAPKHDAPEQSEPARNLNDKAGHGLDQEGPAPPTSMPPSMIQEETINHSNTPVADNVPQVVIEGNPRMVTPLHKLTSEPAWIDCPLCNRTTKTRITKEGSSEQTLAAALCCIFCICLTCLPCVAGWCENIHIWCTGCGRKVAMIPHDGPIKVLAVTQEQGLVPSKYPAQDNMNSKTPPK
ncbi:hypothetical protein HD806DRAFT_14223 [Xylariaceae sp. AK1471]|nr:hypothetical protein HD806DRAFT_14223 [Xylariaceae sp. AK1471]